MNAKKTPTLDDGPELVAAFLERPIRNDLRKLSRFGSIDRPRFKVREGVSSPDEIAQAWCDGFNGRAVSDAFFRLLESDPGSWPQRKEPKAPAARKLELFEELPEISQAIRAACDSGEAIHHIRSYVTAMKKLWTDLNRARPMGWTADSVVAVLRRRHVIGVGSVQYPLAGVRYLWLGQKRGKFAKGELERFMELIRFGASLNR
ncbi:MAG: hypothetical protein ABIJ09_04700 [Pseudomonadota bacterium]